MFFKDQTIANRSCRTLKKIKEWRLMGAIRSFGIKSRKSCKKHTKNMFFFWAIFSNNKRIDLVTLFKDRRIKGLTRAIQSWSIFFKDWKEQTSEDQKSKFPTLVCVQVYPDGVGGTGPVWPGPQPWGGGAGALHQPLPLVGLGRHHVDGLWGGSQGKAERCSIHYELNISENV